MMESMVQVEDTLLNMLEEGELEEDIDGTQDDWDLYDRFTREDKLIKIVPCPKCKRAGALRRRTTARN